MPAALIPRLPEELLLRTFTYLRLDDLYEVMRTCKQFHRISRDLPATTISEIALRTGEFLPGLQPSSHVLLVAAASSLRKWVVEDKERRARMHKAMHGGIRRLAEFALESCPVTLDQIRDVWHWKQKTLGPASNRLNKACGPPSRGEGEDILTTCEDSSLALWNWTLYGELFRHEPPFDQNYEAPLDLTTRLKFIAFCVPDVNCCSYLGLQEPHDFLRLNGCQNEYQQLDLYHAFTQGTALFSFLPGAFAENLSHLMAFNTEKATITPGDLDDDYTKESFFLQIVRSSGRRSLEVLQYGDNEEAQPTPAGSPFFEALVNWLNSVWATIDAIPQSELRALIQTSFNPFEPVKSHVNSFDRELMYTMWGVQMLQHSVKEGLSYEEVDRLLRDAVDSGRKS